MTITSGPGEQVCSAYRIVRVATLIPWAFGVQRDDEARPAPLCSEFKTRRARRDHEPKIRIASDAETAEEQVAEDHKISESLRDRLVAIREDW